MIHLLGLDPGGQTGFALVEVNGEDCRLLDIGQFPERDRLNALIKNSNQVIFEDFSIGPRSPAGVKLIALEVIGAIKQLCEMHSVLWKKQMPDQRRFIQVRKPEWVKPFEHIGGSTHAYSHGGDALMHVLTYAYRYLGIRNFKADLPDAPTFVKVKSPKS